MSTYLWNIEGDMCRCCHAEGSFKNLDSTCYVGSTEEVCVDLIQYALNIHVPPVEGKLFAPTYKICGQCIHKLIEAARFRLQVVKCEKKFRDLYKKKLIAVSSINEDIKEEPMENISPDDDGDDDDKVGFTFNSDVDDFPVKNDHREEPDDEDVKPKVSFTGDGDVFGVTDDRVDDDDDVPLTEMVKPKMDAKMEPKKYRQKKRTRQKEPPPKQDLKVTDKKNEGIPFELRADYTVKGNKEYVCNTCARAYESLPAVKQHIKHVHLKLRPKLRSCHKCDVKVPSHLRSAHMEEAHGIPAPACGACGKKFAFPHQVLRHQKNFHMGEKWYNCQHCDMTFSSQNNLGRHIIKHTGERNFKCEFCSKSFKWRENLKTHIRMHLGERRHVCPSCGEGFVQQSSLRYHTMKRHPEMI